MSVFSSTAGGTELTFLRCCLHIAEALPEDLLLLLRDNSSQNSVCKEKVSTKGSENKMEPEQGRLCLPMSPFSLSMHLTVVQVFTVFFLSLLG